MAENYIVINGKKAELTPKQLKALGLEKEIKNPFERRINEQYYIILADGDVCFYRDKADDTDDTMYRVANYCTDREMMEQRALHETLNRLLWRYSMEHGGSKINWSDDTKRKYFISYNHHACKCIVDYNTYYNSFTSPYFTTMEAAENAIKEIVEPFVAEHPDFEF